MKSFVNYDYKIDKDATEERKDRPPLTEEEVQSMLNKADSIEKRYFRLRAKAVVAIARVFGKRRSEIASLKVSDLKIEDGLLVITFTLRKKRKRGLFQYIRFLEGKIKKGELTLEEFEAKTQGQLTSEWRQWQDTKEGVRIKQVKSRQGVELTSHYAQLISEYWEYVKSQLPDCVYLFPAGKAIFSDYAIDFEHHIGDGTLLDIVKALNPDCWMHLFREFKGGEVAKKHGRTLESVYEVKEALDLENEATAYNYVKRSVVRRM
jgi:integrase